MTISEVWVSPMTFIRTRDTYEQKSKSARKSLIARLAKDGTEKFYHGTSTAYGRVRGSFNLDLPISGRWLILVIAVSSDRREKLRGRTEVAGRGKMGERKR